MKGFEGRFFTLGIDIWSSDSKPDSVYIFAVNHLPDPLYYTPHGPTIGAGGRARSQIEIFEHTIGSNEATYLRTVRHPLIQMPNDLLVTGPDSFYLTNDHYYREGTRRMLEELIPKRWTAWSNTVHVKVLDMHAAKPDAGIDVNVALTGLHTNNGLGRASKTQPNEIIIVDATGGELHRAHLPASKESTKLKVFQSVQLNSTIDNPFYYDDPYPNIGGDASGYILAGLARGIDAGTNTGKKEALDPVMVWHVRGNGRDPEHHDKWEQRLIFQDPGDTIRTASTAVLLGIDPTQNGGKKQAWLFVTGYFSKAMIATKIDL